MVLGQQGPPLARFPIPRCARFLSILRSHDNSLCAARHLLGLRGWGLAERRQPGTLRLQKGYDHSYFFVSSFMEDHVDFHAQALWS